MYSLKNRAFAGMLALLMLLSMTGCAGTTSGEESSGSTITQEEYDALKEQNEKLQAELDELKGETDGEAEDGTEPDASGEGGDASGSSASGSAPADNASSSAPAQTSSAALVQQTAPAQTSNTSSGKGPMSGYNIEVYDWETPSTTCLGESYNGKAGYVLRDASSNVVGMVPSDVVTQLLRANGLGMAESEVQFSWFVNAFNEYRGVESSNGSSDSSSGSNSSGSGSSSEYDEDEYRSELFRLINDARKDEGLEPLNENSTAMEFAQIRAEELAEKFSHIRPDGSTMTYSHYNFAEIIAKGSKTPNDAVKLWLDSSGHRAAIMADYSAYGNYMGVGVYRDGGISYWVVEFIGWDANA